MTRGSGTAAAVTAPAAPRGKGAVDVPRGKVTRVDIHQGECNKLLRSPGGAVHREVSKHTRRVTNAAKMQAPTDTGKMRAQINGDVNIEGKRVVGRVEAPSRYAYWQHEGTGVYAGKGPIRPKHANALVFRPKKGRPQGQGASGNKGPLVFAKQVKGTPPTPFLVNALNEACPWPMRREDTRT